MLRLPLGPCALVAVTLQPPFEARLRPRSRAYSAWMGSASARIHLCGRLVVEWDGERLERDLPGRQGRLLFAYLVLNRDRPVRRDELIDALWSEEGPPPPGVSLLPPPLSRLRKAIGASRLEGRGELSLTLPEDAWIDWEVARDGLARARAAIQAGDWRAAWEPAHEAGP